MDFCLSILQRSQLSVNQLSLQWDVVAFHVKFLPHRTVRHDASQFVKCRERATAYRLTRLYARCAAIYLFCYRKNQRNYCAPGARELEHYSQSLPGIPGGLGILAEMLKASNRLKESKISISEDYSKNVLEQRKELFN